MKNLGVIFFLVLQLICSSHSAIAQPKIIVTIDTAYRHTGKLEFPLSQFGDEITDFYGVFPDILDSSNVTICGKIGTADPKIKRLGLVQLTAKGVFDSSFGNAGRTILNWGVSDYPNSMFVASDSSIFLSGASGQSLNNMLPALFKFKKNGIPDSSFGSDGHIAIGFDSASGEFNMISSVSLKFIAGGYVTANSVNSHDGFCAMRFLANGRLDSSYGINGKALIPCTNSHLKLHSVYSYLTMNASITFIGLLTDNLDSSHSQVVLGKLNTQGIPDSSFGTNGFLVTGITLSSLTGTSIVAGIQPDYKIVAGLPPPGIAGLMPVRLVRFTMAGIIDSTFGTDGFTSVAFSDGESRAHGINIAKNGKTVIAGSAVEGFEHCATSRNNIDGTPDLTLNQIGTAVVDVDSGMYSNYLIRFVGIGNKRYIGVGASIHDGVSQFLVARFKDDTLSTGGVMDMETGHNHLQMYPNPVSSVLTIETGNTSIGEIHIIDALGREVKLLDSAHLAEAKAYTVDASVLPNGMYYCIAQYTNQKVAAKFLVAH